MNMNDPPPAAQPRSFKNKTLQYTLVSSFLLASVVLWISHHAVISSSAIAGDKQQRLLSVPLPRRQAASGGLPPVPDFVKQKLDGAKWFIDAIRQRQNTLLMTMTAIMNYQREFFLTGDETNMKPMILKDIAEIVSLDISTISRVANSKYVQTNYGIYF